MLRWSKNNQVMNALVKKEIRQLLPSFLLGLLLAFSIWLIPVKSITDVRLGLNAFPFICCPVVLVMMMLDSFGHELSAGTFSLLLSQPVPRTRIWWTKTLLLAAAALLIWLVWCFSYYLHDPNKMKPEEFWDMFVGFGIVHFHDVFGRALDGAFVPAGGGGFLVHGPGSRGASADHVETF